MNDNYPGKNTEQALYISVWSRINKKTEPNGSEEAGCFQKVFKERSVMGEVLLGNFDMYCFLYNK